MSSGLLGLLAALAAATLLGVYRWRRRWSRRTPGGPTPGPAGVIASLASFAHALTHAADDESLKAVAVTHVPIIVSNRRAWVMVRGNGVWKPLVTVGETPHGDRERSARRAVGEDGLQVSLLSDDECFPVVVADAPACVLGVSPEPSLTAHQRSVFVTAIALLASSLKNAELRQRLRDS